MIISKFYFGIVGGIAVAIAAGFGWQIRLCAALRKEAERVNAEVAPAIASLEKQIVAEKQRLALAEASVSPLRATANAARRPPSEPARMSVAEALAATMTRARQLIAEGKLQDALDEYVRCYGEFHALRPGGAECQNLMSAIQNLMRTFPAARLALGGLRDAAMEQWKAEPNRRELISEIALLNDRLGDGDRTLALYDSLPAADPSRPSLATIAVKSLIAARRYSDALAGKSVGPMLGFFELRTQDWEKRNPSQQAAARQSIVDQALTDIEVLTGAGKFDDARALTEKLFAFDSSEATHAALKERVERAQPVP